MRRFTIVAMAMLLAAGCKKADIDDDEDDGGGGKEPGVKKISEAVQHLREIGKTAKQAFRTTGKFPIGKSTTLPIAPPNQVAKGCCGASSDGKNADNKCPVADWAADPVWKTLGFTLSEPSNYRYTYESTDGTSFTVTAEGDLDCDGAAGMFTIVGKPESGKPKTKITKPAAGEY